ncbi:MAG TPA: SEL1-like repeat protein, partial [Bryobacteraceae bacterium]
MYTLGCRYERGDGTEKALAKAIVWYRKAATAGSVQGMNRLGEIYRDGDDGAKDYGKAQSWFRKAATGGSSDAMNNLGLLYSYQRNFPPDYKVALNWFQRSAKLGNAEAINNLGMMYLEARGVTRNYVMAREWFERAAALNNNSGRIDLGYLYEHGLGVTKDIPKAIQLYETAAAEEHPEAIEMLGQLYRDGTGVPKDQEKAREYFEKAAELSDAGAMYSLGEMYEGLRGSPRDPAKAKYWYERAASRADQSPVNQWVSEWAMERLGDSYQSGIFTERNYQTSLDWFRKAAHVFNSPNAMDQIAGFYEYGYGVPKDAVEAQKWHAIATALRPPAPPVTPQCAEPDLETKLRVFDQLGRHAIAIEKRNLTKAACKLGNYTLAPNQVAHAWRMWRTRADDGSTAGCNDLFDNHYLNGVSIASPTLLPPVCSGLEVHDFTDGPFVPSWTAYTTTPLPPAPKLVFSTPKAEYMQSEHVPLRLNIDGIDAATPKTGQGCPIFFRTITYPTGLIRMDEMTPAVPDPSGNFSMAINCYDTAFRGTQHHEFEFDGDRDLDQKASNTVRFFTLSGRSPQGEVRLVLSNSAAIAFKDPAEMPRKWGATEQGVRVALS